MITLDPNWREALTKHYSTIGMMAGLVVLLGYIAAAAIFDRQLNPFVVTLWIVLSLSFGILGKVVIQTEAHKWKRRGLIVIAVMALLTCTGPALANPTGPITAEQTQSMQECDCDPIATAAEFTGSWEGRRNHAYLDRLAKPPVWTICDGWTIGVREGDYLTDLQCNDLMARQVPRYRAAAQSYMTNETKAERLTCLRDVSITSLVWNIGHGAYGRSTALRRLNSGDIKGSCHAMTWYNKAGGKVWFGLVRRRTAEEALCLRGLS